MRTTLEGCEGVKNVDIDFAARTAKATVEKGADSSKILATLKASENAYGQKLTDSTLVN